MALKIRDGIPLQLIRAAAASKSVDGLLEQLDFLDRFGGDSATVELTPDIPASDNLWCWYARRDGECFYNGGLLHRDGSWSIHS